MYFRRIKQKASRKTCFFTVLTVILVRTVLIRIVVLVVLILIGILILVRIFIVVVVLVFVHFAHSLRTFIMCRKAVKIKNKICKN